MPTEPVYDYMLCAVLIIHLSHRQKIIHLSIVEVLLMYKWTICRACPLEQLAVFCTEKLGTRLSTPRRWAEAKCNALNYA